jgi:hypothetical protein
MIVAKEQACLESLLVQIVARFTKAGEQIIEEAKSPDWLTEVKINCFEDSITILIRDLSHE